MLGLPTPTGARNATLPFSNSVRRLVVRFTSSSARTTWKFVRSSAGTQPVTPFGRIGTRMCTHVVPYLSVSCAISW